MRLQTKYELLNSEDHEDVSDEYDPIHPRNTSCCVQTLGGTTRKQ